MEEKKCLICSEDFIPKRADSRFCSKICNDKWYHSLRKKATKGNIPKKKIIQNPHPPKIDDAILLDQQLLKAIKKSVANQIIKIIQEAFA